MTYEQYVELISNIWISIFANTIFLWVFSILGLISVAFLFIPYSGSKEYQRRKFLVFKFLFLIIFCLGATFQIARANLRIINNEVRENASTECVKKEINHLLEDIVDKIETYFDKKKDENIEDMLATIEAHRTAHKINGNL